MKLGFFHLYRNQDLGLVVLSANRGDLVAVLQCYAAWSVFLVHVLSESQILVTTSVLPGDLRITCAASHVMLGELVGRMNTI